MEEAQVEAAKVSKALSFFPPHRRRPLKSETCRTLVRILSHCYEYPNSLSLENVDHELTKENGSDELGQRTEKQAAQQVELVGLDGMKTKSSASEKVTEVNLNVDDNGSQDKRLTEQMSIDQIEQLMILEENEDLLNQKDVIGPEQMLIDELEHIVKGNEDIVHETNSDNPKLPLVQNDRGINEIVLLNNRKEHGEYQQIDPKKSEIVSQKVSSFNNVAIGVSATARENDGDVQSLLISEVLDNDTIRQQKDRELNSVPAIGSNNSSIPINEFLITEKGENQGQKVSEGNHLCSEKNTVATTLVASNTNDDHGSLETNALKVECEKSCKHNDLEETVSYDGIGDSANHMMENVDIEEGEISGDCSMDDFSMDVLSEDSVMLEDEKVNEEPINKDKFSSIVDSERDVDSTSFLLDMVHNDASGRVGLGESNKNKTIFTSDMVVTRKTLRSDRMDVNDNMLEVQKNKIQVSDENNKLVMHGQSLEEDAPRHQKISTIAHNAEVCVKKKRGPPSKEKRARRKQKERQKRAEKNRQLGVKRLILPLISKPKTVIYCRHFLNGRCHEGDKCKFSHDIVPLTKSKPCCHFARHSCLKGDDCPFDHQLSKYPCSNFVSKGFCSRGDACMFSHKMVPKADVSTASNAVEEPEKKLLSLSSKKQLHDDGASQHTSSGVSYPTGIHPHKNTKKNMKETVSKQSELVTIGTSFLSAGNLSLGDSSKLKQQLLSPNIKADAKTMNHIEQHGSGTVQKQNEILNRTPPVVTPKGINFLSFGRAQKNDFISRSSATSPSSADRDVKLSSLDNSTMHNQTSSTKCSNLMLNGSQPEVAPKGINFLSFGKAPIDNSLSKGKGKLASNRDNGTDSCVRDKQNALDEPQSSSTTSLASPSSQVSLLQSSDHSAPRIYKETRHSAHKALISTLAFAAKYESQMKPNQSIPEPAVRPEIDKEARNMGLIGGSQNEVEKPSKFFELLSRIGGKSKQ